MLFFVFTFVSLILNHKKMTKKKIETLNEMKRKSLKISSLVKKIDESDKLGISHRHKGYLEEMDKTMEKLNSLHLEFKSIQ